MDEEENSATPFTPRSSIARTPPDQLLRTGGVGEKRQLSSPEEKGGTTQKPRTDARMCRPAANPPLPPRTTPPISGIASGSRTSSTISLCERKLAEAGKIELLDRVHGSIKEIMKIITGSNSKLNKADTNIISSCTQDTLAVVAALNLRLSEAELDLAESRRKCAELEVAALKATMAQPGTLTSAREVRNYAGALKLSRSADPVPIPTCSGPVLAFYPAPEHQERFQTAEDTKLELKKSINPKVIQAQVENLRKVGNAGVVVQTTSEDSALRLKNATPSTLRVSEPKKKAPQICLRNIEGDPNADEILCSLWEQNLRGTKWTTESLNKETRVFKRNSRRAGATTVIIEGPPELRDDLIARGKVYLGWQVVEVCDYLSVTCCNKCQQYGHPEKYCRSAEVTCGKCGESGHRRADCKNVSECCATCKKFGRKEATSHTTAAKMCPARQYAEQRALATTNYG